MVVVKIYTTFAVPKSENIQYACFVEVNPIPVKEAMNLAGFDAGTPRAPLTKIEDGNREKLIAAMKGYGLEVKA